MGKDNTFDALAKAIYGCDEDLNNLQINKLQAGSFSKIAGEARFEAGPPEPLFEKATADELRDVIRWVLFTCPEKKIEDIDWDHFLAQLRAGEIGFFGPVKMRNA